MVLISHSGRGGEEGKKPDDDSLFLIKGVACGPDYVPDDDDDDGTLGEGGVEDVHVREMA